MRNIFRRKKDPDTVPDDGILILSKPGPVECGGTDATLDTRAPKVIESDQMTFFYATSALNYGDISSGDEKDRAEQIAYVSAFAAPAGKGCFLFLSTDEYFRRYGKDDRRWAFVKKDLMPALVSFVREQDLAKQNGYHSTTHGLPENFGGSVDIRYASGERISFSDNQGAILSVKTARALARLFREALRGEKVPLPPVSALREIRFEENRANGGFTHAALTILPDGTGSNRKSSHYDDPRVYESTKPVEKETIDAIRKNIEETGVLAWAELPANGYSSDHDKHMTFRFDDGTEITVRDDRLVPDPFRHGFFNIELDMATKH